MSQNRFFSRLSIATVASALALTAGLASTAEAKCYGFRGQEAVVCVPGQDNASRNRAVEVCEEVTGESSCRISGIVGSSCQEGSSRQCYDESGERHRRLTGY